jgi:hypothetical protein
LLYACIICTRPSDSSPGSKDIDSFLEPLVEDLVQLGSLGFQTRRRDEDGLLLEEPHRYRAYLILCFGDMPAMAKASLLLSFDLLCVETIELPSGQADELILPISCSSGPQLMKMTGHNGRRPCRCCNIWGVLKDDGARATSYCTALFARQMTFLMTIETPSGPSTTRTTLSLPSVPMTDSLPRLQGFTRRTSRPGGMTSLESMGSRDSCVFSLSLPICIATRSISDADAQESNLSLESILFRLGSIRFPDSFPLDLMHLVYENVVPNLLKRGSRQVRPHYPFRRG